MAEHDEPAALRATAAGCRTDDEGGAGSPSRPGSLDIGSAGVHTGRYESFLGGSPMTVRNPAATRQQLLQAAHREVYEKGIAAASLDAVLSRAHVTKGALYHHFAGKKALCQAVIDEVVSPMVLDSWAEPLRTTSDPVSTVQEMIRGVGASPPADVLQFGCPLNNLAQEVAAIDDDLRAGVYRVFAGWVAALRDALARGQGAGTVRPAVDPEKVARFIVGAIEGAISLAKSARDASVLRGNLEVLDSYLESLRPS